MLNFCTLFDSNYLPRALAMYESLKRHNRNFHLYVFAFDDKCYDVLNQLSLEFVTTISLKEFEDEELLKIKNTRSAGEYCWTCTPSIIKYIIEKYNAESCTYLDADLYFFSDPSVLIEEMGSKSVLITEHRYTPKYDRCSTSGIYCVQFMTFKNDANGMRVLNWWRNACNEWCYARYENGKFGDQKYLDHWPTQFEGIHVLQHLGGGLAPWNVQQYDFENISEKMYGTEHSTQQRFEVVFYHFHALKFSGETTCFLGAYAINTQVKKLFYHTYVKKMKEVFDKIIPYGITMKIENISPEKNWTYPLKILKRILFYSKNFYPMKEFT
ncbi:hypothetical protein [Sulfuricurvum sp.]|uniref:hypothetical protein n=1 Tax=Sulfuricurvum sp. TaxID=2025608 RepID=UPI00286E870A|nr:hypothetical protein [Sulfuricurvum sp.]